jgi:hypothetical protein
MFANVISHTGSTCARWLPITPQYSSRPSTNCSTIASVVIESWMNCTRSRSLVSSSTTDACEMPIDASCVSDLTITGYVRRLVSRAFRPRGTIRNSGTGMRWYCMSFFESDLSRREEHARGITARVGQPQQLEVADHVLIERADLVKVLEQVEGDVRFELVVRLPDSGPGRPSRRARGRHVPVRRGSS